MVFGKKAVVVLFEVLFLKTGGRFTERNTKIFGQG
jgi:hypothetical protein